MFMGYASLFGLQKKVKIQYGIEDDNNPKSHMFGYMVTLLYIYTLGNLKWSLKYLILTILSNQGLTVSGRVNFDYSDLLDKLINGSAKPRQTLS